MVKMRRLQAILKKFRKGERTGFVYFLGDDGAILIYIESGVVIRRLFSATPEQALIFIDLLVAHKNTPIYVLVDMMDQSYVRHSLPPVTKFSLNKLIKRRLDRDFAKEDIKSFLILGRERDGRKDWNSLLISLVYSDALRKWLDVIYELPNRLMGIYLVPVEAQSIIAKLHKAINEHKPKYLHPPTKEKLSFKTKIKNALSFKKHNAHEVSGDAEWQLLSSHDKVGGFRQVVLRRGVLIFTRLTQLIEDSQPEVIAGSIEQEIQNTIEYLKRLSYSPKSGLDIYVICAQEVKDFISPHRMEATSVHLLSPYDAAQLLGLKQAVLSGDRYGDVVLAASFGMMAKKNLRLDSAYSKKLNSIYQAASALQVFFLLAKIVAVLCFGGMLYQLADLYQENQDLQDKKQEKEQKLSSLEVNIKKLPKDLNFVSELLRIDDSLQQDYFNPIFLSTRLSKVISDDILIKSMSWENRGIAGTATAKNVRAYWLSIKVSVVSHGDAIEKLQNRMKIFSAGLEKQFPEFQVTHGNFPWDISSSVSGVTVNFSQNNVVANSGLDKNMEVEYILEYPKDASKLNQPMVGG